MVNVSAVLLARLSVSAGQVDSKRDCFWVTGMVMSELVTASGRVKGIKVQKGLWSHVKNTTLVR